MHGGSWSGGRVDKKAEVLNPSASDVAWRRLSNIGTGTIRTADKQGLYRSDNHAWLFGWSSGSSVQLHDPFLKRWLAALLTQQVPSQSLESVPVH